MPPWWTIQITEAKFPVLLSTGFRITGLGKINQHNHCRTCIIIVKQYIYSSHMASHTAPGGRGHRQPYISDVGGMRIFPPPHPTGPRLTMALVATSHPTMGIWVNCPTPARTRTATENQHAVGGCLRKGNSSQGRFMQLPAHPTPLIAGAPEQFWIWI